MTTSYFKTFTSAIIFLLAISLGLPGISWSWELIGEDALDNDTKIYLRSKALEDLGNGQFYVITLTVHPRQVRGIDLIQADGKLEYDTRFPHSSFVTVSIYDCPSKSSADGQTLYFSGERPNENELVYHLIEDNPVFIPEILTDPVFNIICE